MVKIEYNVDNARRHLYFNELLFVHKERSVQCSNMSCENVGFLLKDATAARCRYPRVPALRKNSGT